MIDTKDVIDFFDRLAPGWDADMFRNEEVIGTILDNAGVSEEKDILDVASGTGVLIPDYLKRNVKSVTAIDISPRMIEILQSKYKDIENLSVRCEDVESAEFDKRFDSIVIYNAFPHFPDPDRLIAGLAGKLNPGGILTVAHGMSREKINAHHSGTARPVSNGLMTATELAGIFEKYLDVTVTISNERMYQVAGVLKYPGRS